MPPAYRPVSYQEQDQAWYHKPTTESDPVKTLPAPMADKLFQKLFDGPAEFCSPAKALVRFSEDAFCDSPMTEYLCTKGKPPARKDRRGRGSRSIFPGRLPLHDTNNKEAASPVFQASPVTCSVGILPLSNGSERITTYLSGSDGKENVEPPRAPSQSSPLFISTLTLSSLTKSKDHQVGDQQVKESPLNEQPFKIQGPSVDALYHRFSALKIHSESPTSGVVHGGKCTNLGKRKRASYLSIRPASESPGFNGPIRCDFVETNIKTALDKVSENPNFLSDGSRCYTLPTVPGKHQDLKSITPETLSKVLNHEYDHIIDKFVIVDCRYPYEFEGGHIEGARNIYTKDAVIKHFMNPPIDGHSRPVLIFHCEFSSERAPKLCRYLRSQDRDYNEDNYPTLCYPEMYLLHGGYKNFFGSQKNLCHPQTYTPMNHPGFREELRKFRNRTKAHPADSSKRARFQNARIMF